VTKNSNLLSNNASEFCVPFLVGGSAVSTAGTTFVVFLALRRVASLIGDHTISPMDERQPLEFFAADIDDYGYGKREQCYLLL
jgi:hypothetical protein